MSCFISVLLFGCTPDASVSEKIPLIFFAQTAPGENETALAYSSVWEPQQGILDLNPKPSFELVKLPELYWQLPKLYWQGDQQIILPPSRSGEPEISANLKNISNHFEIITSRIKVPMNTWSELYYAAGQSKEYLAYDLENKIILLENQGDETIENTFIVP